MEKFLGIYIHIPFCKQKCYYCDFCSAPAREDTKQKYVLSLIENIRVSSLYFADRVVDSVFFGGGTPTCLSYEQLDNILEAIKEHYRVAKDAEISLECNPATADLNFLQHLRQSGFNRLSIGVQSAHNEELKALGRIHTFEDFQRTYLDSRVAGFENINIDIMYGIPCQTESSFEHTLESIVSFSPEHISAYALKIEPGTVFFKNKEKLILPDEDSEYNMYKLAVNLLRDAGYRHYEISNYAKNGFESRHNLKYWNCDDYVGLGISAHSCIGRDRYAVISSLKKYITCDFCENSYYTVTEKLTSDEFIEEYIMMRLRLGKGLNESDFKSKFGKDIPQKYIDRINTFVKKGYMVSSENGYHFSDDGMYLSNYFLSEILDLE